MAPIGDLPIQCPVSSEHDVGEARWVLPTVEPIPAILDGEVTDGGIGKEGVVLTDTEGLMFTGPIQTGFNLASASAGPRASE